MNNKFLRTLFVAFALSTSALPMFTNYTELQIAAMKGDAAELKRLINDGVDINTQDDNENGWAALHYAAWNGRFDCVKLLVENGANPYANTKKGETPADLSEKIHFCPEIKMYLNSQPAGEYRKILELLTIKDAIIEKEDAEEKSTED